jgi:hypothetical protein
MQASTNVPRAVPWIRQHSKPLLPTCPICNEPVELKTGSADENGHAMHEECYLLRLRLMEATTMPDPDS